jgi:hypothetical protein
MSMSGNQELFQALQMFKQGVGELAFARSLQQANQQVRDIKGSEMDEAEQRAALSQVANSLTMSMAGMGVPATTIAQVSGAVAPKQFASADQMMGEGFQSGNQGLVDLGKQWDEATTTNQMKLLDKKEEMSARAAERADARAIHLAEIKGAATAAKEAKLTEGQMKNAVFAKSQFEAEKTLSTLEEKGYDPAALKQYVVGSKTPPVLQDPEMQQYAQAMWQWMMAQGRKESGGAIAEEEFDKYSKIYFAAPGSAKEAVEQRRKRRRSEVATAIGTIGPTAWERANSVDPDKLFGTPAAGASAPAAPQMTPVTVRDRKTGQMIKALRGPDGKLYPAGSN